jgi:hypothetical protein
LPNGQNAYSRRVIGCNTPRRCIRWGQGCRHDIAFPLESALGQVNTEQTARNPRHWRLLRKSYSGGQTTCLWVGESILHCVKSNCRLRTPVRTAECAPP